MFKNYVQKSTCPSFRSPGIWLGVRGGTWGILTPLVLALLVIAGCVIIPALPPANLAESGWNVRQGQVIWRSEQGEPDIAGELLVATNRDGCLFVQFTKTPFPLLTAQYAQGRWEVRVPTQNKRYAGRGRPPSRLIWLHLPGILAGKPPPTGWVYSRHGEQWRIEDSRSGELLEGFLLQ